MRIIKGRGDSLMFRGFIDHVMTRNHLREKNFQVQVRRLLDILGDIFSFTVRNWQGRSGLAWEKYIQELSAYRGI